MMNKCEFCGSTIPYNVTKCPNCGAPCPCIPDPRTQEKANFSASATTSSSHAAKNWVKSMEDVPVSIQSSNRRGFLDDMEDEVDQFTQKNARDQAKKAIGCILILVVLGIVIYFLMR